MINNKQYVIETQRLHLRTFELSDAAFVQQLLNSDGWLKYIGDRNVHKIMQAEQYLQNGPILSYKVNGYGLWLVEKKEGKVPIGMCGILKRDTLEHPDIGFAFLPDFTGKGYAHEAAEATLKYAKNILGIACICAITATDNVASIRLLKKIGLRYIQHFCFPESEEELLLYRN